MTGARVLRWCSRLALAMACLAPAGALLPARAQQPTAAAPDAPVLRIESGAHTAAIRALSVDAAGRIALTAAEDKTARLWDLADGRLLQVLRPPIGAGNEGRLYAGALSPDAAFAAVAGWSRENEVYVFNRSSGQLVHRIAGLPNVVTRLTFTPDGRRLLVSLWGRNGVRLYASDDGWRTSREAAADREYEAESYGADFSSDGSRLATTAFDGQLRLYAVGKAAGEPPLRLVAQARPEGGTRPLAVAFAPDRQRLALSFADTPAVTVLDAARLATAYVPSVAGVDNGSFSALAWSADGRQLLAAGSWKRGEGQHGLRRWADGGRGAATDATLAGNTVVALAALPDGRLAWAAADPAWGVLAPTLQPQLASHAGLLDFRGPRASFRLANAATAVGFGLAYGRNETAAFDLDTMAWREPGAAPALAAGPATTGDFQLDAWFESTTPVLNQRRLALENGEIALSAAAGASGNGPLVLGTNFNLRAYDRQGAERWRTPAPASAWQVAQSSDGRWVVAGFADGSLRWYRARDGAEQLALLPHADRRRWVAWTPQGYYAASAGGEDLIGWHLNRGPLRAADFFAASRLRATFFRPDVIAQVLARGDAAAALAAANEEAGRRQAAAAVQGQLPPVVAILSPADGGASSGAEARLALTVRAPVDAPATSLRVRVNGSVVELPGGGKLSPGAAEDARYELRVPVPAQDAEIMVFAENRNGFSTPAVLRLRWSGTATAQTTTQAAAPAREPSRPAPAAPSASPAPPAPQAQAAAPASAGDFDPRPTLYVLAIGVSRYRDNALRLQFPAKDAGDFAETFRTRASGLYRKVVVKQLTDDTARRDDVLDGLEWIRREVTSRDVALVFLAGHGVNDSDGVYYYLPQDVELDRLKRTGVIFTEIRNTLAALPGKAIFFVDTCHAGNVLGTARRGTKTDITAVVNELSSAENGVIVFAASTGRQDAQESSEWGNGAFTKAVLEGVTGKADFARTGRITHKMLDLYTSERVKALTRGSQSPVTIVPQGIPDFPLVVTR